MLPSTLTPQLLRQLELLKLKSRRSYLGSRQGGHLSLKRGHGIEFSDYRQYEIGDHPRYIDWNVYARSERIYVKRFQEEEDISILILLDTSASMGTPAGEGKWERARDLAIALSYVGLLQQDTVNIAALGKFFSPQYYGGRAIHHIGNALTELTPSGQVNLVKETLLAVSQIRFPGVAIFISDFLMPRDEIRQCFNLLRAKNLDITALQVLSPSDISPFENLSSLVAVDSETGEEMALSADENVRNQYGALLQDHNQWLEKYLTEAHISHVSLASTKSLDSVLVEDLTATGLLQ